MTLGEILVDDLVDYSVVKLVALLADNLEVYSVVMSVALSAGNLVGK